MKYIPPSASILLLLLYISCVNEDKVTSPGSAELNVYSEYEYIDPVGKHLLIKNGCPKGGIKYIDSLGNIGGYVVFWTRIINYTDNPLELKIDLPIRLYTISNFPGKYFKVFVPADTMTTDQYPLVNYGLDVKSFLDNNIHKPSSLKRAVPPKESSGLYFVMLILTEEATGATRAGLSLKGRDLFYKISRYSPTKPASLIDEIEIHCGSINLNLKLPDYELR